MLSTKKLKLLIRGIVTFVCHKNLEQLFPRFTRQATNWWRTCRHKNSSNFSGNLSSFFSTIHTSPTKIFFLHFSNSIFRAIRLIREFPRNYLKLPIFRSFIWIGKRLPEQQRRYSVASRFLISASPCRCRPLDQTLDLRNLQANKIKFSGSHPPVRLSIGWHWTWEKHFNDRAITRKRDTRAGAYVEFRFELGRSRVVRSPCTLMSCFQAATTWKQGACLFA